MSMSPLQIRATSSLQKVASLQRSRLFSKVIGASPLRMRIASLKQHDPCVQKTHIQSLLLQSVQQYTGTSRRLFTPGSTVRQQPAQNCGGSDYVSRHSPRSSLVASKGLQYTHEEHISDRIKLRVSQMIINPIMRSINSAKV